MKTYYFAENRPIDGKPSQFWRIVKGVDNPMVETSLLARFDQTVLDFISDDRLAVKICHQMNIDRHVHADWVMTGKPFQDVIMWSKPRDPDKFPEDVGMQELNFDDVLDPNH